MELVNLTIDGVSVSVPAGTMVLEAARQANIHIPTLCYLKGINQIGACRICVVDTGARTLQAACVLPVSEGMNVKTNTSEVINARRVTLELILSTHDKRCLACVRNQNCELQALCFDLGVGDEDRFEGEVIKRPIDQNVSPSIVRDPNKCVLCRRCEAACYGVQNLGVIGATNRGFKTIVEPAFNKSIGDVDCINCGQCIVSCPVGALSERDDTKEVWEALNNPEKVVVVQPAPSVRVAVGEEFGMPIGSLVTGKMVTALKRLGFDKVFDTDFGADLTIVEEAHELLDRLQNGGVMPMFTSCSPGWVRFVDKYYPEFMPNLSSCKSPHQMVGAVIKTYFAQKAGIDPKNIVTVSVMPCTAKKFEAKRVEMQHNGLADVDIVITTREFARMIKTAGIDFVNLPDGEFDELLGESTGAGVIFGATGGVMEAAIRTAADILEGKEIKDVDYHAVRGIAGIKEAEVELGGKNIRVAVASSTGAASQLLDKIKAGEAKYDFIEVMACPGGCVNGGGQPIVPSKVKATIDPRVERAKAIYTEDELKIKRKSHENTEIKKLYEEFLGKPNGEKAHQLLHVHSAH